MTQTQLKTKEIEFHLHSAQTRVWQALQKTRFVVLVAGRRFGKTTLAIIVLIISALSHRESLYWYVAPNYRQAKMIAWKMAKKLSPKFLIKNTNESELSIDYINGSKLELKGADNEDCYSSDTEILTDKGWKLFKELDRKEMVLTMNQDNLKCEWKKPKRYIEHNYSGEFWSFKNNKYDFLTSPNHKYFVISDKGRKKFKTLDDVANKDYIPQSVGFDGEKITHDEMAFMGIYLAEGTAYGNCGGDIKKRKGAYSVFIAQTDGIKGYKGNKGDVKQKIKDLLDRLGYKWRDRGDGLEILNKELWEKLIGLGNKYTKYIPKKYKNASTNKLKTLIDWMVLGDGSSRGVATEYYTVSKQLADDFQEVAFKAGYSAKIAKKKNSGGYIKGRKIKSIAQLYNVVLYHNEKSYFYGNKETYISKTQYNGKIYCVEVDNNVVLVRRNGKAGWSGNSLRGVGLHGMVIDEFASIYNKWDVWNEVLRPTLTDKRGWVLFIGTPKGKDAFYELYTRGERLENNFASFKFKTIDNPYIDKAEVEEARQSMPARFFRQEYEASFEDFTGLIYPEFAESVHVCEPFALPEYLSYEGAIDPAISGTTGVLKSALLEDGRVVIYDEYYERDVRVSEVAKAIKDPKIRWLIDPAAAIRNVHKEGRVFSLIDEYNENGIFASPAENDVDAGINRVGERFKTRSILIFSNCKNLIMELLRYHWAEIKETIAGSSKPKPFKSTDHLCDCLKSIIMSRTTPSKQKEPQPSIYSAEWYRRLHIKEKQLYGVAQ